MATIVLRIKPVEAEFARMECGTDVVETSGVLYTLNGIAVDPTKMAKLLSDTFEQFGFSITIAPLRHGLEAFAHKFHQRGTGWSGGLVEQANHGMGTSARYGRDDQSFVGIPMDISEDNYWACNDWNTVVIESPSIMSDESRSTVLKQLEELDLLGPQSLASSHSSQPTQLLKRLRDDGSAADQSKRVDGTTSVPVSARSQMSIAAQSDMSPTAPGEMTPEVQKHVLRPMQSEALLFLDDQSKRVDGTTSVPVSALSQMSTAAQSDMSPIASCEMTPEVQKHVLRPMQSEALLFLTGLVDSAIIIMPTGSGKTQLIMSHRRVDTCSVIFAPYDLLCRQLLTISEKEGTAVVWPFKTFKGSHDALLLTADFAILPYEAAPLAHNFVAALHEKGRLGPMWIDEVRHVLVFETAPLVNTLPGAYPRIQRQVQRHIGQVLEPGRPLEATEGSSLLHRSDGNA
jgi:hypothetical protein